MTHRSMPLSLSPPGAASARSFRLRFPEPAVEAAYLAFHRKE